MSPSCWRKEVPMVSKSCRKEVLAFRKSYRKEVLAVLTSNRKEILAVLTSNRKKLFASCKIQVQATRKKVQEVVGLRAQKGVLARALFLGCTVQSTLILRTPSYYGQKLHPRSKGSGFFKSPHAVLNFAWDLDELKTKWRVCGQSHITCNKNWAKKPSVPSVQNTKWEISFLKNIN